MSFEIPWDVIPISDVPEVFLMYQRCLRSVPDVPEVFVKCFRDVLWDTTDVLWLCYACVWCQRCLMYSCILYQWCHTVNKCLNDRCGSTLSDLFTPCSCCPKITWVKRTQLSRPSISGWYYPSVPGGSEIQLHCVTIQNCIIQVHTFQPSKVRSSYLQRTTEMYYFSFVISHMAPCFVGSAVFINIFVFCPCPASRGLAYITMVSKSLHHILQSSVNWQIVEIPHQYWVWHQMVTELCFQRLYICYWSRWTIWIINVIIFCSVMSDQVSITPVLVRMLTLVESYECKTRFLEVG